MEHSFISLSDKLIEQREILKKNLGDEFNKKYQILELFYHQFNMFTWTMKSGLYENSGIDLIGSSIIKSFNSLLSSLILEQQGLFGSSRMLMRFTYEYLLVGKYYSSTRDSNVLKKWRKELKRTRNDISVRKLLKNIENIDTEPLIIFWSELCEFAHATPLSQQIGFSYDYYKKEFNYDQAFIIILLNMMFHYMHIHFVTQSIKNAYNLIGDMTEWNTYLKMKERQKQLLKELQPMLGVDGRKLYNLYKRKWELKPSTNT